MPGNALRFGPLRSIWSLGSARIVTPLAHLRQFADGILRRFFPTWRDVANGVWDGLQRKGYAKHALPAAARVSHAPSGRLIEFLSPVGATDEKQTNDRR